MKALLESINLSASLRTALLAALVMVAACGGKPKPDSTDTPASAGQDGDKAAMGEHGEMAMPPQVTKFHDTLGPRWHAPQGPQRMTDTCAAMAQLHTDADAIVAAPAPSGANAAAWSESGKQLAAAVTALDATCQAKDAAAFEPAFTRVHTSFHHVMEASSAHPEGHEAHDGHDGHSDHKM